MASTQGEIRVGQNHQVKDIYVRDQRSVTIYYSKFLVFVKVLDIIYWHVSLHDFEIRIVFGNCIYKSLVFSVKHGSLYSGCGNILLVRNMSNQLYINSASSFVLNTIVTDSSLYNKFSL